MSTTISKGEELKKALFECDEEVEKQRWIDLDKLLLRKGPFAHESFNPEISKDFLHNTCKVLIIGAGGLGCDLVKNLAMTGFKNIHIIDMDTIDLSNLNRQFLFRSKDIGSFKSEVAARFVNMRVCGAKVTAHTCKIQEKSLEFYEQFHIVISGLDSISARRWMNSTLISMVECEEGEDDDEEGEIDMSTVKPFIDGGTEGFKGQARVITPQISSCFECTMDLFPPQTTYPRCTIASNPRLPEHCIMYALEVEWNKKTEKKKTIQTKEDRFNQLEKTIEDGTKFDGDNPVHVQWVYEMAQKRAKEYGIRGVTYRHTQGVAKNIIPAIASTNAVVASVCANEAFKLATLVANQMNDYMMYNGNEGIYTYTYKTDKKSDCFVCGFANTIEIKCRKTDTLAEVLELLKEHNSIKFTDPTIASEEKGFIYNPKMSFFKKSSEENLKKTMEELEIAQGEEFTIVDSQVMSDGLTISFVYY